MPIIYYFPVFLFGLCVGSFLNCLIWRLHKNESMWNRSYCPKCRKQIAWYDNIPVLSFILLRGKCRHCGKPISWQYPIVELIAGLLFVLAFFQNFQFSIFNFQSISNFQFLISKQLLFFARDIFFISVMIVVFIYDLRWYLILDAVTLPACAIVLILNLFLGISWQNLLVSGIIGSSFFLIQFLISKGRWIGGGDIRLGLLLGLALGWPNVLAAILIAYFIGSIIGIGLIIAGKKQWGSKVPLGVFLSAAAIIVLFWGDRIINWYLNLL
ncbi:prepilin peptidase [Candidatus Parcubacteria bacterium]|nr:prepilin peptidase [Candidatus Parcubacteria bacterium]